MKHNKACILPTYSDGSLSADVAVQLPIPLTSFVGREQEISRGCMFFEEGSVRLLTLTGPGGVGKTRLSLAIATRICSIFPDGVFFISLASLSDPSLLLPTICSVLELEEQNALSPFELLITSLRHKSLLLLLDNFEHLLSGSPLLIALLQACPMLKILVTSRAVLHVQGEQVFEVLPLPFNEHAKTPEQCRFSPAIQLFVQRAQARKADFVLDQTNSSIIALICRHLDGLPLAIELAAAWINLFPAHLLLQQLERRALLLTAGSSDAPWRQHTLHNTLCWSYDLLSEQERRLFRQLSLFVGGSTLDTIETILAPLWHGMSSLVHIIGSLVDKSLLFGRQSARGILRLSMLEMIREFALEYLQNSEEEMQLRQKHAEYFLALAEEAELKLMGPEQLDWLQQLEQEEGNLRAALNWFATSGQGERALRLAGALLPFWVMHNHMREGHYWFESLIEETSDVSPALRAKALYALASFSFYRDDLDRATILGKESLNLFRELNDERNIVLLLHGLGHVALARGCPADVLPLIEETLPLVRKMGDRWKTAEALFLSVFGYCAHEQYSQARAAAEESLVLWREFEDHHALTHTQHIAGYVAYKQNYLDVACSYYRKSLATAQQESDHWLMTACLVGLGEVAAAQDQLIRAVQLWGVEESLRETITVKRDYVARSPEEQVVARVRSCLGEEIFSAAWLRGRTMSVEQVLSVQDQPGTPEQSQNLFRQGTCSIPSSQLTKVPLSSQASLPTAHDELTAREIEVLRLIALGLTNAQVADQLVLSPLTINTYIRSIYRKLGIHSRSAATRYALEHGLTL